MKGRTLKSTKIRIFLSVFMFFGMRDRATSWIGGAAGTKDRLPSDAGLFFAGGTDCGRCGGPTAPAPGRGHSPPPVVCPRPGADAIGQAQRDWQGYRFSKLSTPVWPTAAGLLDLCHEPALPARVAIEGGPLHGLSEGCQQRLQCSPTRSARAP